MTPTPARPFSPFQQAHRRGAANLGLAEALTGAGYDLDETARRDGVDPMTALARLLDRAGDPAALDRMVAVARQGLQPPA